MNRITWHLRASARAEEGFGLIEVAAALGVMFVSLLILMSTSMIAFKDVGMARQRQAATGIANDLMEQVRAMPVPDLDKGLDSTDAAFLDDAEAVSCSGVFHFRSCDGEKLLTTPGSDAGSPLVPHRTTVTLNQSPTVYTSHVYVMEADPDDVPESGAYQVVVVVTWPNPMRGGAIPKVETRTLLYQPVGCVDPALNPHAAPCSAFLAASGLIDQGRIEILDSATGTPMVSLLTPGIRSQLQMEQISAVQATAHGSGALEGDGSAAAAASVSALADDDPSTPTDPYESKILDNSASSSTGVTAQGSVVSGSSSSTVETLRGTAASAATATSTCPTAPLTPRTDGQPCEHAHATQQAGRTSEAGVDFRVGGTSIATASLARMTTPTTLQTHQRIDGVAIPGQDGYLGLAGVRQLNRVELVRLPSQLDTVFKLTNLGWQGYLVAVEDFTDAVSVQAGTGTSAPTATVTGGTLRVWNGASYDAIPLSGPVTPRTVAGVSASAAIGLVTVNATLNGQIEGGGGTSTTQAPSGASGTATRTEAEATVNAPLRATFTYRLEALGSAVDLTIIVDLGTHTARAQYKEAPSA